MKAKLALIWILFILMGCSPVPANSVNPLTTPDHLQVIPEEQPILAVPTIATLTPIPEPSKTSPVIKPGINPLTGLPPAAPALLNRRPIIVKVENLPRNNRPQFGLSLADIVYEYHTEEGTTRYAAVFYGQNAEKVGPIRSGRWFDIHLIQMYKSIFIFGSAYEKLLMALVNSDFGDRLVLEGPMTEPVLKRYDPNGKNLLLADITHLEEVINLYKMDNSAQSLEGMFFDPNPPEDGLAARQLFVRFSGAIYNRWDYDPESNRYRRFVDVEDDINNNHEVYTEMVDQLTGKPVDADNVVMIMARNFIVDPGVYNIDLTGSGTAYLARDGQIYKAQWQRKAETDVLTLVDTDGHPLAFKPGRTWFEVISLDAPISNPSEDVWRFRFVMPE